MRKMLESNKLHKVTIIHDGNQSYTLSWNGKTKVFRGTKEEFAKFLMKLKAKETDSLPKSARRIRYSDMADRASGGKSTSVFVWDYMLKRFPKASYTLNSAKKESTFD